jgi:hypothetical protein
MLKGCCVTKVHRDAQARNRLVLLKEGWLEAPGERWINPRTGMVTDFRGALDRESLRNTFVNLKSQARTAARRGRPTGNHVSPVRKAQFA